MSKLETATEKSQQLIAGGLVNVRPSLPFKNKK